MITPDVNHALRHYIMSGLVSTAELVHAGAEHADLAAIESLRVAGELIAALGDNDPTTAVERLLQSMADSLDGKPVPEHTDYIETMDNDDVVRGFRNGLLGDIRDTIEAYS